MAHAWTETVTIATFHGPQQICHLSDGTLVYLRHTSTTNAELRYSSDHATTTLISNILMSSSTTGFASEIGLALCRDNLDNIYVLGRVNDAGKKVGVQAFVKGAGYSWTPATRATSVTGDATGQQMYRAVWCNTGGGTNSKGHLFMVDEDGRYHIMDAGAALAGTCTVTASTSGSAAWTSISTGKAVWLCPDGFGAVDGILTYHVNPASIGIQRWVVGSAGTLTTNTNITTTQTGMRPSGVDSPTPVPIRVSANVFAIVGASTYTVNAGVLAICRYSKTAQLTAPTTKTLTNNAAFVNAATKQPIGVSFDEALGIIYVLYRDSTTGTTVRRFGCAVAAGVTWDAGSSVEDTGVGSAATDFVYSQLQVFPRPVAEDIIWMNAAATNIYADIQSYNAAPNAPTLTAPTNGATQDLAAGYTFTWTFSDPNPGDTQSAYALRRKVGAGAYEYWNAGTASWQGSEVWNASGSGSATFGAGKWANGTTYQWSVATKDAAGLAGAYASDFTIVGSTAATVTVTAPTGTVTTSSQPDVAWSVADPESDAQETYQIKVESGAYSTTPGSGTSAWDSGEISNSLARTRMIGTPLTNGTTYRVFVRVKTIGQYSAWAYSTFTISLDAPATPSMTATPDNANNRVVLVVSGHDNVVDANTASIETDATGWAADANMAAPSRVTTDAVNGSASLQLSSSASGDMRARTATRYPVNVGTTYTAVAKLRAAVSARSVRVLLRWYTAISGGSLVATTTGASVADGTVGYTQATASAAAPATATHVEVVLEVLATGGAAEVHRADTIGVWPGTSTTWTRGGIAAISKPVVQYSDDGGTTWANVRGTPAATFDAPATQQLTVYDYEATPYKQRSYRPLIEVDV